MNDAELKARLQGVPVPERTAEYWQDFPSRVRVQLRRQPREYSVHSVWRPRLQWAGGFALALALMYVGERFHPLQSASAALTKQTQNLREQTVRIQTGLQHMMFNTHGMGYLLAEAN